jgi:glycosyltransferase involved in cell wall biosynthesis
MIYARSLYPASEIGTRGAEDAGSITAFSDSGHPDSKALGSPPCARRTVKIRMSTHARGIVLYDFLYTRGGAERVALEMARGLPGADLGFGSRDRSHFPDDMLAGIDLVDLGVRSGVVGARTLRGMLAYRTRTTFLRRYDWVIYSGSVAQEAVFNHPQGANIYYCHTIPRFAYDLYGYYAGRLDRWQLPLFWALVGLIRRRYPRALARMDKVAANSENVRQRIGKYLGLDAAVVYPPCDVDAYRWLGQGGFYLSTARLEPYKRVDLIIDAFRYMPDKKLVVASGGSAFQTLKRRAAGCENIHFAGWVDDAALSRLMGNAIATLYLPKDEDFGMSPVESMAAGKPVIGVAEGGLMETVVHGETGMLLSPEPTVEAIIAAVRELDPERALGMRVACERRARLFSRQKFLNQMRALVGVE